MNNKLFIITYSKSIKRKGLIKLLDKSILYWMYNTPNSLLIITTSKFTCEYISNIIQPFANTRDAWYAVVNVDVKGGKAYGYWPVDQLIILDKY